MIESDIIVNVAILKREEKWSREKKNKKNIEEDARNDTFKCSLHVFQRVWYACVLPLRILFC